LECNLALAPSPALERSPASELSPDRLAHSQESAEWAVEWAESAEWVEAAWAVQAVEWAAAGPVAAEVAADRVFVAQQNLSARSLNWYRR
jgi:hypothetical protein